MWTSGYLLHHEVARPGPAVSRALGGGGEVSVLQRHGQGVGC